MEAMAGTLIKVEADGLAALDYTREKLWNPCILAPES
jgi:hypothetical protein